MLFLSRLSELAPGKPIRGGVPIVFPWFAADLQPDRIDGHPGPSHGFARTQEWTLISARLDGPDLLLRFTLGPTAQSRAMGFDRFLVTLDVRLADTLTMDLAVSNLADVPLRFEQAFHTYLQVADIHEVAVSGLEPTPYLDKTDDRKEKPAAGAPIHFLGPLDRVYLDTAAPQTVTSGAQRRRIHVTKRDSRSTIVWNLGKPPPDLGEWDWHEIVAVECANIGASARTARPGQTLHMGQTLTVERLPV